MNNLNLYNNRFFAMNTRFEIIFWGNGNNSYDVVFDRIKNSTNELELLLSCYDINSETYKINKRSESNQINLTNQLFDIIVDCQDYKKKTCGCFDFVFDKKLVYNQNDLSNSGDSDKKYEINYDLQEIILNGYNFCLDFGSVGKGIALQKTSEILANYNIENAFISFGESSILTIGRHPHGEYWPFAIMNMKKNEQQLVQIKLNDHFVSTSSTYNNLSQGHIINPTTNKYIKDSIMVSVKSHSPIEAEILSTALLVANFDEEKYILEQFENYEIVKITYDSTNHPKIRKFKNGR
jgi:thiamine biosynthesis lipoprotein